MKPVESIEYYNTVLVIKIKFFQLFYPTYFHRCIPILSTSVTAHLRGNSYIVNEDLREPSRNPSSSVQFWWWCVTSGIAHCLDLGLRAVFIVNINITTFRRHERFPSSGKISEKRACLGSALGFGAFLEEQNRTGVPLTVFLENGGRSCYRDEML